MDSDAPIKRGDAMTAQRENCMRDCACVIECQCDGSVAAAGQN